MIDKLLAAGINMVFDNQCSAVIEVNAKGDCIVIDQAGRMFDPWGYRVLKAVDISIWLGRVTKYNKKG